MGCYPFSDNLFLEKPQAFRIPCHLFLVYIWGFRNLLSLLLSLHSNGSTLLFCFTFKCCGTVIYSHQSPSNLRTNNCSKQVPGGKSCFESLRGFFFPSSTGTPIYWKENKSKCSTAGNHQNWAGSTATMDTAMIETC